MQQLFSLVWAPYAMEAARLGDVLQGFLLDITEPFYVFQSWQTLYNNIRGFSDNLRWTNAAAYAQNDWQELEIQMSNAYLHHHTCAKKVQALQMRITELETLERELRSQLAQEQERTAVLQAENGVLQAENGVLQVRR